MTGKKDLLSTDDAAEELGVDAAEVDELLESGELRRVWHRAGNDSSAPLESYLLGADVDRLQQQNDPRYMAKIVAGEIVEPDEDGDTPQTLAAKVQRL